MQLPETRAMTHEIKETKIGEEESDGNELNQMEDENAISEVGDLV